MINLEEESENIEERRPSTMNFSLNDTSISSKSFSSENIPFKAELKEAFNLKLKSLCRSYRFIATVFVIPIVTSGFTLMLRYFKALPTYPVYDLSSFKDMYCQDCSLSVNQNPPISVAPKFAMEPEVFMK